MGFLQIMTKDTPSLRTFIYITATRLRHHTYLRRRKQGSEIVVDEIEGV
jgi:hypothetical protein